MARDGGGAAGAVDGRRERRRRGREAVIESVLELLAEGAAPPTTDAIVARSGVSLSSIFRYFENLDDLQQQAIDTHLARHAPLFEVPGLGEGPLDDRVRRFTAARLDLYEAIAPVGRLARARAPEHARIEASLVDTRATMAAQVEAHFAPELADRSPAAADDLVVLVASLTSFEAWDLLTRSHARTRPQVRRAWSTALLTLLT
jgi:AcrR family transcriptional regulator